MTRRWPLLAAALAAAAVVACVFAAIPVRSDMADLLPQGRSEAARAMLRELREGQAAGLILAGIEGAPEPVLAALDRALAAGIAADPAFVQVENGGGLGEAQLAALFARRYALAPADPQAFAAARLRDDLARLRDALASSAAPFAARFLLPDPTGAFPALMAAWSGQSHVRLVDGLWFAADAPRALLLARLRGGGLELAAGGRAIAGLQARFDRLRAATPGAAGALLALAGPAVFARDAEAAIRRDVRLLAAASAVLVAALLLWRFRSPAILAAIAVPVLLGVAAGALATVAVFGFLHGLTLGFGMTMLGITVDYPVLLVGHRKPGESVAGTFGRIGATFATAVAAAALGLAGMVFAGMPAVAQLGVFGVAGVLGAALATRLLLPPLIVAAGIAPVSAGDPRLLHRVERWRRARPAGAAALALAAGVLALAGPPPLERSLAAMSPVPAESLALDARLRRDLGAPEPGQIALLRGPSAEAVLQAEEALVPTLDRLTAAHAIAGAEYAARLLPSAALQAARARALPDAPTLAARIGEAATGLGFAAGAFAPFQAAVEAARTAPPLTLDSPDAALLRARTSPLLIHHADFWLGVVAPLGLADLAAVRAALDRPGVLFVDIAGESGAMVGQSLARAAPALAAGGLALVAALAIALRNGRALARILLSVLGALLATLATLRVAGRHLTLIELVSLQFVAGVALDYALFFARPRVDEEERARTLRTLVTCATMALLTFGLLGLCRTPLLRGLGVTVALGVGFSFVSTFLFAGAPPARRPPG